MKKLLVFLLTALMLIGLLSLSVFADNIRYAKEMPTDAGEQIFYGSGNTLGIAEYHGNVVNLNDEFPFFCCKFACWVRYEFEAEADGVYTIVIEYVARPNCDRGLDYAIDSTEEEDRVYCDLDQSEQHRFMISEIELEAGIHSVYIFAPTGFNDATLKSCDVYGLTVFQTSVSESEPVTEPVTEAPETTPSPTEGEDAPQTLDGVILLAAAAVAAAASAGAIGRRRRH